MVQKHKLKISTLGGEETRYATSPGERIKPLSAKKENQEDKPILNISKEIKSHFNHKKSKSLAHAREHLQPNGAKEKRRRSREAWRPGAMVNNGEGISIVIRAL